MNANAPRVGILMGSASDMDKMSRAADELRRFGVGFRIEVTSAHRSPERTLGLIRELEDQGVKIFIVGAGMAAHLAGVVAAHTTKPVLGVPLDGSPLVGFDALMSTVQMPKGIPVGTLAVGSHGATNAGILACQILALSDEQLAEALRKDRTAMADAVERASADATAALGERYQSR